MFRYYALRKNVLIELSATKLWNALRRTSSFPYRRNQDRHFLTVVSIDADRSEQSTRETWAAFGVEVLAFADTVDELNRTMGPSWEKTAPI